MHWIGRGQEYGFSSVSVLSMENNKITTVKPPKFALYALICRPHRSVLLQLKSFSSKYMPKLEHLNLDGNSVGKLSELAFIAVGVAGVVVTRVSSFC
jgi:Leucine-rich repeat (LRR) protein